jgi:hypothetical protein
VELRAVNPIGQEVAVLAIPVAVVRLLGVLAIPGNVLQAVAVVLIALEIIRGPSPGWRRLRRDDGVSRTGAIPSGPQVGLIP